MNVMYHTENLSITLEPTSNRERQFITKMIQVFSIANGGRVVVAPKDKRKMAFIVKRKQNENQD